MKYNFLLLLLFSSFISIAQQKKFDGVLSMNKETMKFSLEFEILPDQSIEGKSITGKGSDMETVSRIKGRYNPKQNAIFFYETIVLSSKSKLENLNFCLLTGTLDFVENKDGIFLQGKYIGFIRGTRKPCGNGAIKLKKVEDEHPKVIEKPIVVAPTKIIPDTLFSNQMSKKTIQFESAKKEIQFEIWDDVNVDGDVVSVYLNGKKVLENYTISKDKKILKLNLANDANYIKVVSINEGKAPPTTARIRISDGKNTKEIISHILKKEAVYINISSK